MQPRLKTSKKWTPLPQELVNQIQSVFKQNFQEHIQGSKVEAAGKIYPEEILIGVGFSTPGVLKQINWEISIGYAKNKDNVLKLLHLAVDAVGALFEQSFNVESDHDFPRVWQEVDFEGRRIFIQYTTTNTDLEAQADRLLGIAESEKDVAQGEWDEDIGPEHIKAQLGLDESEEESVEDSEPAARGPRKPQTH